jgi:putative flavoprotein involved in K+ transport
VAGDGATGRQIARELAATREVVLAGGKRRHIAPRRVLGRDVFWWLDVTGAMRADRDTAVGRWLRRRDPIPGRELGDENLRRGGIRLAGRVTGASPGAVTLGGETLEVDAVVWTLGYRDDTSWVQVPDAADARGFAEDRGVSPVPGLFFTGRPWQRDRASALVQGAGDEGRRVTARVLAHLATAGRERPLVALARLEQRRRRP